MAQAKEDMPKGPIKSRWVVVNKGDALKPDIRARLVACEINVYKTDEFYASTPPLEAKNMLFSQYATDSG